MTWRDVHAAASVSSGKIPIDNGAGGFVLQGDLIAPAELTANKGLANGYAALDSTGKVPLAQLPPWSGGTSYTGTAPINVANGVISITFGTAAGTAAAGNDARIVGAAQASSLATVATSGSYADLTNKPTIPAAPVAGTAAGTFAAGNDSRFVAAEQIANKGAAGGYASLDSTGKVPAAQLPATSGGSAGPTPVTVVSASGAAQALAWPSATGRAVFDVTLTANCTLTLTGNPPAGEIELVLYLRQDSTAGRTPTLPAGVRWTGQSAPVPNTAAGVIDRYVFRTPDQAATVFGGY